MGVINTGNIPRLLWPGLNAIWGREYTDYPMLWSDMFDKETSEKAYELDVLVPGFGLAPVKDQGAAIVYDSYSQGFTTTYTHVAYGLGFVITKEAIDDNLYEKKAMKGAAALARSFRQTKENVGANVYNNGFSTSYPGGDGAALFSASHPTQSGNQSNLLSTAADLSEVAIEDLCVQIMNAKDDRGLRVQLMPDRLLIPTAYTFDAERILKSTLQSETANNALNALRSRGVFKNGYTVNPYFTDSDAWFIRTDCPDGMKMFERTAAQFSDDNDFDTSNLKYKGYERYSFGWSDFRGAFGSSGS